MKINEGTLRSMIKESLKRILNEEYIGSREIDTEIIIPSELWNQWWNEDSENIQHLKSSYKVYCYSHENKWGDIEDEYIYEDEFKSDIEALPVSNDIKMRILDHAQDVAVKLGCN